jgi:hypothetical protein
VLVHSGVLHYGSAMSANFYAATLSLSVATVVTLISARLLKPAKSDAEAITAPIRVSVQFSLPIALIASAILVICAVVNVIFH